MGLFHTSLSAKYDDAASLFRTQTPQDYHFIAPEQSYASNLSLPRRADSGHRHLCEQ